MAESFEHHKFVEKIYDYVRQNMVDPESASQIKAELYDCERPQLFNGSFIPDVLYRNTEKLIIGEAKTFDDYKTEHSYQQYESYLNECVNFPGEATMIICLPWELFISAQNHLKRLKMKYKTKTKIVILSDNDKEAMI